MDTYMLKNDTRKVLLFFFLIIKQFSFCRIRNLLCTVKTLQFIINICLEYALSGFYWYYVVSCHRQCKALMSANVTWVSSDSLYIIHHYRKIFLKSCVLEIQLFFRFFYVCIIHVSLKYNYLTYPLSVSSFQPLSCHLILMDHRLWY